MRCKRSRYFSSVNISKTLEIFPVFPASPVFLGGKKRGKPGEKLFDKNGPVESVTTSTSCTFHIHVCRAMYVMYIRQTLIPYLLVGAVLRTRLRSHSELFVVVFFADYSTKKTCFLFFSSRSYTISSIYVVAVGSTPYGKWHTSRTEPP